MKVLGIVFSPRKGGNTEIMVEETLAGARTSGAETELWTVAGKYILPCDGCEACRGGSGSCHIDDDIQKLYPKVREADGIVFGSPVYFRTVTAQALIVMQRMFPLTSQRALANKVGGVVTVAAGTGHDSALLIFDKFFNLVRMFRTDMVRGFGRDKGEIRGDILAMKLCEELGKFVVAVIKQQLRWPQGYETILNHYVFEKFGIGSLVCSETFKEINELRREWNIIPRVKQIMEGRREKG